MGSSTQEEDRIELDKWIKRLGRSESKEDPNLVEDCAYRIRYDKGGVVWHSWVDPNRPDSPPVEWPQYPKEERPDDYPEDGVMSHEVDPAIEKLAREAHRDHPNKIKPIRSRESNPCGQISAPVEDPDKADEILDSVFTPKFPGLYSSEGDPRHSEFYGDNYIDDYGDDFNY